MKVQMMRIALRLWDSRDPMLMVSMCTLNLNGTLSSHSDRLRRVRDGVQSRERKTARIALAGRGFEKHCHRVLVEIEISWVPHRADGPPRHTKWVQWTPASRRCAWQMG
jgi:hypothetical protein